MSTEDGYDLTLLWSQVDDWFTEITLDKPICQFSITDDKDKAKLATITRTTLNWFKGLENPLTSDGIEDEDLEFDLSDDIEDDNPELNDPHLRDRKRRCTRTVKTKSGACRNSSVSKKSSNKKSAAFMERQNLDLLVKDLELLLENDGTIVDSENGNLNRDENEEKELEFYMFNLYDNDEHALLDDSIGYCCTVPMRNISSSLKKSTNNHEFTVVTSSNHLQEDDTSPIMFKGGDFNQEHDVDLKQKLQTPMPLDHDYLPRIRTRPSALNNKLIKSVRHKQLESTSVLNTEVIKRFARFSSQFRVLRDKHEKLMAIENK